MIAPAAAARCLATATGLFGMSLVLRPGAALRLVEARESSDVTSVTRVLGVRVTGQALAMIALPQRRIFAAAAAVDAVHAASMLLVAGVRPRYRRAALASAAVATGSAIASSLMLRRLPS